MKMMYASLYFDDLYAFFNVPAFMKNVPLVGDLQTAEVITTETLFDLFAGLGSLLFDPSLIEDILGISDGDSEQTSEE